MGTAFFPPFNIGGGGGVSLSDEEIIVKLTQILTVRSATFSFTTLSSFKEGTIETFTTSS